MLTPYVTGLVFANSLTAVCLIAVIGALRITNNQKISAEFLTHLLRRYGSSESWLHQLQPLNGTHVPGGGAVHSINRGH